MLATKATLATASIDMSLKNGVLRKPSMWPFNGLATPLFVRSVIQHL